MHVKHNNFMSKYFSLKLNFLLFILFFSSCVSNIDLEYFSISTNESKSSGFNSNSLAPLDTTFINFNDVDYALQVGDLISVQISSVTEQQHDFFNKEQTSNSQLMLQNPYLYGYLIKKGGFLDLPSFGKVKAEGFNLRELENKIKKIAVSYFEQPIVKLNIINFEISVLGAVNNPGVYKIVHPNPNLLFALSLASDITEFGNRKLIKIIRKNNTENRIFHIDMTDIKTLNNPNFMLQPNDVIYVAPLNKRFYAFTNLPSLISMSISAITLYLLINNK